MSTHWLVTPSNEPHMRTACRMPLIDGNGSTTQDQVTCPECLAAVIRSHCNAVADEPGPLPARCARPPHKHGSHDWVPGSDALRHADFARQALDRIVPRTRSLGRPRFAGLSGSHGARGPPMPRSGTSPLSPKPLPPFASG